MESTDLIQADLPDYAPQLVAFHAEFAPELATMLDRLPIEPGQRVLEVACGDGWYSARFAEKVGPSGRVVAIDNSPAWLRIAGQTVAERRASNVELAQADARQLPLADKSFDFVWCAQSFYSLPDIGRCLEEMVRVLRPGGTLAILEDDTLHHVLLPWPIDLELELRQAEFAAFEQERKATSRFYVGRWLSRLLRRAGLRRVRARAVVATRQTPLSRDAATFFGEYLRNLSQRVRPRLSPRSLRRFDRLVNPASRRYLLCQADFVGVSLDRLVSGIRPNAV
jgi:ubiquinone/menaquinone biosynthesis C-methylase UbiE